MRGSEASIESTGDHAGEDARWWALGFISNLYAGVVCQIEKSRQEMPRCLLLGPMLSHRAYWCTYVHPHSLECPAVALLMADHPHNPTCRDELFFLRPAYQLQSVPG